MAEATRHTLWLRARLADATRDSLSASLGVCQTMLDGDLDPRVARSYSRAISAFDLTMRVALEAIDHMEIVAAAAPTAREAANA